MFPAPEEQTFRSSMGFLNDLLSDWYGAMPDCFEGISFKEFADELREYLLPLNLAGKIGDEIVGNKMKPTETFEDLVHEIERLDTQLGGATRRFSGHS